MNTGAGIRRWLTLRRSALALALLALALLAPHLFSGAELVRLRNAWSLGPDLGSQAFWQPPALPARFKPETVPVEPYFGAVAAALGLAALADDDARVRAISAHLLGSAPQLVGGAVRADLRATHQAIAREGRGYCGDFVRVYMAIANAAGMTVRPWAFLFDGFGGRGHIWVESWNHERGAWQLVDVFQNYEFVLADGVPLSALRLRAAMYERDPALRLRALDPAARPGWAIEAKAWDYFYRGLDQWYALWGNNVMSRDAPPVLKALRDISPAVSGSVSIMLGLRPQVRILPTPTNAPLRQALREVRQRSLLAAGLLALAALLFALSLRRRGPSTTTAAAATTATATAATAHAGTDADADADADADTDTGWPRVALVGPLPPPAGGMANQCEQLARLLRAEGAAVELVRSHAPCRPALLGRVPVLRALVRLPPYLWALWRAAGRCEVLHVLANSGWAWHLFAAPALWVGRLRGTPVIVNYRGGLADEFLSRAPAHVGRSLRRATLRVTPSAYLQRVFARHALDAEIIPNIVDLDRFGLRAPPAAGGAPHIVVARNLEPIYGLDTAIRALALLRRTHPQATLTLAGSGPQRDELQALARSLALAQAVHFPGRIAHADMPALYARADLALNPSTVDNMPNSVLEAFASGVPLVSTHVGGVPDIVDDGVSGLLVPPGDPPAMAAALARLLDDAPLAQALARAGRAQVAAWGWPRVREQWRDAYRRAAAGLPHGAGT